MRFGGWLWVPERAHRGEWLALGEGLLEVAHLGFEFGDPSVRPE